MYVRGGDRLRERARRRPFRASPALELGASALFHVYNNDIMRTRYLFFVRRHAASARRCYRENPRDGGDSFFQKKEYTYSYTHISIYTKHVPIFLTSKKKGIRLFNVASRASAQMGPTLLKVGGARGPLK